MKVFQELNRVGEEGISLETAGEMDQVRLVSPSKAVEDQFHKMLWGIVLNKLVMSMHEIRRTQS